MRTIFVDRFGATHDVELTTNDFCPECCGPIEPINPQRLDKGMRCASCGLEFKPKAEEKKE
jgi:hypothetical protein